MKKNVLALSIATMIGGLGFTGAAFAAAGDLAVTPSGDGHILMVPYYTVQDGNVTAFNIVNTDTKNGKAVKVRFRGASNSDDVLDFQVFLSPGDVWTAAVTADANGLAQLVTADNSCTLPKIELNTAVPFIKDRLTKAGWTDADKNAQTREGYIEILNMADIDPAKAYDKDTGNYTVAGGAQSALYKATKHVSGVAPCTDTALSALNDVDPAKNATTASAADTTIAATLGLKAATGGLTGNWFIMNAAKSTTFSAAATAIKATDPTAINGALLNTYSPQRNIAAKLLTADPLMVTGAIAAQAYDVPDLSTPTFVSTVVASAAVQASKVSEAIAQSLIANQFLADSSINAATDWVISMPTRRYTVAANYSIDPTLTPKTAGFAVATTTATSASPAVVATNTAPANVNGFQTNTAELTKAYRVFNRSVHATGLFAAAQTNSSVNDAGQICGTADSQTFYDRSENSVKDGAVFSPGTATKLNVCGETSVVTFGAKSPTGAALAATKASTSYKEGWGHVSFTAKVPVLGAAFTAASNPNAAAGMIGNYGITWPHFYSIK